MFIFNYKFQIYKLLFLLVLFVVLTGLSASSMDENIIFQSANTASIQRSLNETTPATIFSTQSAEWNRYRIVGLGTVIAAEIMPDNIHAIFGTDLFAVLVNLDNGAFENFYYGEASRVAISSDNKLLLTAGSSSIRLWDINSGNLVKEYKGIGDINSLIFVENEKKFAVAHFYDESIVMR